MYTRGLPADVRQDRLIEIADDLWSQMQEAAGSRRSERSLAAEMVTRLVMGVPADLSWWLEERRYLSQRSRIPMERRPAMSARVVSVFAILGGIGWATWPILQAIVGWDWPPDDPLSSWLLFFSVVLGTWALTIATLGLVVGYQDRIRGPVAVVSTIGAVVGGLSFFGAYVAIVALPMATAILAWDLRRIGAFTSRLSWTHIVTAVLILIPIVALLANPSLLDNGAAIPWLALAIPYGLSWIAIGWSFRSGDLMVAGPAQGA
jgi:hypothetical protein